ncbi:MAG: DUF5996 family protein [Magnetospirillum sp.]|nr:DUF5996 family protein [Magnetospirillum sp.]
MRLALTPMANHWWQSPLYLTCRGLGTTPMYHGTVCVEMEFDFIDHRLRITVCDGRQTSVPLRPCSVARFYREVMDQLRELGLEVRIRTLPAELPDAIPFEQDERHASYDGDSARRFWLVLLQADRVLKRFRGGFLGKASPVHFFWGSFDLAVTRFSGRAAPPHPGGVPGLGDWVVREAYSHEVSSCGFWPGNGGFGRPAFYCYAYPEPPGFARATVAPAAAFYSEALREFVLPYDDMRRSPDPDAALMDFLASTYAAAADLGGWDRAALERPAQG